MYRDNYELVWLLWKLLTIFVPTSDALRPYLIKYIGFRQDIQHHKLQGRPVYGIFNSLI